MNWAAYVAIALALVVLTVYAIGSSLSATREARGSVTVAAAPAAVMGVLLDVSSQPKWRKGIAAVDVQSAHSWVERKADGEAVNFTITAKTATMLELEFSSTRGYIGRWRGELTPGTAHDSTTLSVVESATIESPWLRVFAYLAFDPAEFIRHYLREFEAELARRQTGTTSPSG